MFDFDARLSTAITSGAAVTAQQKDPVKVSVAHTVRNIPD
jgi:hypothetical protein